MPGAVHNLFQGAETWVERIVSHHSDQTPEAR